MEVNSKVWVLDKDLGWCPGIVLKKAVSGDRSEITVKNTQTNIDIIFTIQDDDYEHLEVKLQNVDQNTSVDNLVNLMILNEPTILECLQQRYKESKIYTYTGPILIAINPYEQIKDLYEAKVLEMYYNFGIMKSQGLLEHATIDSLPPHAFAIADAAYTSMMSALEKGFGSKDQSILISGESGAGKTETTKLMLRYLTTVSAESQEFHQKGTIMDKVLQSNPILEAFGNAKTVRNDNSSRFGKYVELHFNRQFHLIGGYLRTYLLEKVRICSQQSGERNYHVYYQMSKGGSATQKKKWNLPPLTEMKCANQGGIFDLEFINDVEDFSYVQTALETLEFDSLYQESIFNIVAALVHFGQMQFSPANDGEACVVSADKKVAASLQTASILLGVAIAPLTKAMIKRTASNKAFEKDLTVAGALNACQGLTKGVFSRLFDWIVSRINKELRSDGKTAIAANIGVLDIFGFESFKDNSLEQLCINYTNESLQQQFNKFIFEMEQIEYKAEGIEWSFIEFPNNQDCLDLIGLKGKGIFAALDDECHVPKGSDSGFVHKMYVNMTGFSRFSASQSQMQNNQFCITHYAGPVVYNSDGFMEKNRDEIPSEATELFQASTEPLVKEIFSAETPLEDTTPKSPSPTSVRARLASSGPSPDASRAQSPGLSGGSAGSTGTKTVCLQFSYQLALLMEQIEKTQPHYVRCLKPNDLNKPGVYNRIRITEQLKYGGVLEAVRVARAGFPMRMTLQNFFDNYRCLANPFNAATAKLPKILNGNEQKVVLQLQMCLWDDTSRPVNVNDMVAARKLKDMETWKGKLSTSLVSKEQIQLGKTKVFMRKAPYDLLEGRRSRFKYLYTVRIQKRIRGYLARRWYKSVVWAVRQIQVFARARRFRNVVWRVVDINRKKPKPLPVPVPTPVVVVEPEKQPEKPADVIDVTRLKSSSSVVSATSEHNIQYTRSVEVKRLLSNGIEDPLEKKPAYLVSRKVIPKMEKRYATNDSSLDDFYFLIFGKVPPPAQPRSKVVATVKVNQNKPNISVAGAISETEKAKKSKLGIFYKKQATEAEKKEYENQFPSIWSKRVLMKYFS